MRLIICLAAILGVLCGWQGLGFQCLPHRVKSSPEVICLPWRWGLALQEVTYLGAFAYLACSGKRSYKTRDRQLPTQAFRTARCCDRQVPAVLVLWLTGPAQICVGVTWKPKGDRVFGMTPAPRQDSKIWIRVNSPIQWEWVHCRSHWLGLGTDRNATFEGLSSRFTSQWHICPSQRSLFTCTVSSSLQQLASVGLWSH